MSHPTPQIEALHALYIDLTAMDVPLNPLRVYAWAHWLAAGYGEKQLRAVVAHIRQGIGCGERKPAALKFTYLIEDISRFEEDLACARRQYTLKQKANRPKPPTPQRPDGRPIPQTAAGLHSEVEANSAAAKILADFKARLNAKEAK